MKPGYRHPDTVNLKQQIASKEWQLRRVLWDSDAPKIALEDATTDAEREHAQRRIDHVNRRIETLEREIEDLQSALADNR